MVRVNWLSALTPHDFELASRLENWAHLKMYAPSDLAEAFEREHGTRIGKVYPARVSWRKFNRADLNVFTFTNSADGALIWKINQTHPGVVILFDTQFDSLLEAAFLEHSGDTEKLAKADRDGKSLAGYNALELLDLSDGFDAEAVAKQLEEIAKKQNATQLKRQWNANKLAMRSGEVARELVVGSPLEAEFKAGIADKIQDLLTPNKTS